LLLLSLDLLNLAIWFANGFRGRRREWQHGVTVRDRAYGLLPHHPAGRMAVESRTQ